MTANFESFNNDEINELLAKLIEKFGDIKLKDFLSNLFTVEERLTELKQNQERISKYLDKFISILTYAERVQDEIEVIRNQIDGLRDAVNSVELLKGVIELPTSDDNVKSRLEFYTIKATGECGISRNSLAKMIGTHATNLSKLENTLVKKAPSYYLQSYVNQELTLVKSDRVKLTVEGKNVGNLTIYKSDYCAAVITHYAMKGNKTALYYLGNYCAIGMTNWIQGITGYTANNK